MNIPSADADADVVVHQPGPHTVPAGSWLLPTVLSITAGSVDVIGFLALGGVFTAHITGNVVIVAAHYVTGGFGQVGPLLAVPVFVAVLGVLALVFGAVGEVSGSRRALLILQTALLAICLGLGVAFGPFADADGPIAVLVGMLAVAAMATQNALVRLALQGGPSTAVMTTNITQLTIDVARLVRRRRPPEDLATARRRARVTFSDLLMRCRVPERRRDRGHPRSPLRPPGDGAAGRPRRACRRPG